MHVKLLKELLNLDKQQKPLGQQIQSKSIQSIQKETRNVKKQKRNVQKKNVHKENVSRLREKDDISSNLMKTIVDAYEPVNLDLESISDYDISASSSYDSFYDNVK
jgi:hypothetical protein